MGVLDAYLRWLLCWLAKNMTRGNTVRHQKNSAGRGRNGRRVPNENLPARYGNLVTYPYGSKYADGRKLVHKQKCMELKLFLPGSPEG